MLESTRRTQEVNPFSERFKAPNEAVNFELGCIFIAVPKTGTSSVRGQVRSSGPFLIRNSHLTLSQVKSTLYTYLLSCSLGKNTSFPAGENVKDELEVRSHFNITFGEMFKFGSVRNPWARTYSLYRRREGIQTSGQMSFPEFVESIRYASDTCVHPLRTRSQLDWFKDEQGDVKMDYIFKLEEIDLAIRHIMEVTNGRIALKNLKENVNPGQQSYRDVYTDKEKKHIQRLFEEDIEYFGYSF